jgi:hypothetical protein
MAMRRAVAGNCVAMSDMKFGAVAVSYVAMSCVAVSYMTMACVAMTSIAVAVRAARMAVTPEATQRHGGEARGAQQQTRDVEVHRRERV